MSSSQYRSQLERKQRQQADAVAKAADLRKKEAGHRADAAKERQAASRTSSPGTSKTKLNQATRSEEKANVAGKSAAEVEKKAAGFAKEAAGLLVKLAKAEAGERAAADRRRAQVERVAQQATVVRQARVDARLDAAEAQVEEIAREFRVPKAEPLRILMLGASSESDPLRVGREQSRIRNAVRSSLHRDLVEFDVRGSATTADLLDGLTGFRPHVVHFTGHSAEHLLVFEQDVDAPNDGLVVSAGAFGRALAATDNPPLLVVLNSCSSAPQAQRLVDQEVVPFAIGMSDTIGDLDAISYAAQLYAAIANGQSITSASASGQVAVEMAGLDDHDLPTLFHAPDADPRAAVLVKPPAAQPVQ
ncbi:CHAT domain-containing protein [Peterkaempfera bronchialis]|uniref:CHAT domain-containing protein n=1 Tax=Peterkaempfera bronchialis TaxID=2126346 RepID=A0A345SQV3_9ACTN|nr:hypothetical protein [Peterkaempfera bronchialis]AXI76108.1 hypothetical protein C7M71_000025 [Peterkaempfera bronchialis]